MAEPVASRENLVDLRVDAIAFKTLVNGDETAVGIGSEGAEVPSWAKVRAQFTGEFQGFLQTNGIYATAADGVKPVEQGGVPPGSYYYVRSTSEIGFVDEYQNVGGVATSTGKTTANAEGMQTLLNEQVADQLDGIEENTVRTLPSAGADSEQETMVGGMWAADGSPLMGYTAEARPVGFVQHAIVVPLASAASLLNPEFKASKFAHYTPDGKLMPGTGFTAEGQPAAGGGSSSEPAPIQTYVNAPAFDPTPADPSDPVEAPVVILRPTPYPTAYVIDGNGIQRQVSGGSAAFNPQIIDTPVGKAVKYASAGPFTNLRPWLAALDGSIAIPGGRQAIIHEMCTGQSLSIGAERVGLTLDPIYADHSLMLNTGTHFAGSNDGSGLPFDQIIALDPNLITDFIPAVAWQSNGFGYQRFAETIAHGSMDGFNGMAMAKLGAKARFLFSGHGRDGWEYARLKEGTIPFENGMKMYARALDIARIRGYDYIGNIINNIHGESDSSALPALGVYYGILGQWLEAYQRRTDLIRGWSEPFYMFLCQYSSWTRTINQPTSNVPQDQLNFTRDNPNAFLVTPKYIFTTYDGTHIPATAEQYLGEYYAMAKARVFATGDHKPLQPNLIKRTGSYIDVTFDVPVGNLVIDTTLVSDPGMYGFKFVDSTTSASITAVNITGPKTLRLTLSAVPTGSNQRLQYAWSGTVGAYGGPTTGPRGCLRDSNTQVSRYSSRVLHNYCVHFNDAVN